MDGRYKIIISNKNLYKEIELAPEINKLRVGTSVDCDIRLRKELFFKPIELLFLKRDEQWLVTCGDELRLSTQSAKRITQKLEQGTEVELCYTENDNYVFTLSFMLDFDYHRDDYDVVIDARNCQLLHIGKSADCLIQLTSPYANNELISLEKVKNGYRIVTLKTRLGVYINGIKVAKDAIVQNFDFLSIADYSFYFKGGLIFTSKKPDFKLNGLTSFNQQLNQDVSKYPRFVRNARLKTSVADNKIEILDPPAEPQKPKEGIVMKLLPALAMLALTVVVRGFMSNGSGNNSFIIFSVCSMSIGILTSVVSIIQEKKNYKKSVSERVDAYQQYIDEKKEQITNLREIELDELNRLYIDSETELKYVREFSGNLFDREKQDEDFLKVRLGIGDLQAKRVITYKKQEKFASTDTLADIPEKIAEEYRDIHQAPIVSDFAKDGLVGIVGQDANVYALIKNIVMDLMVRHYYRDLQLFFLIDEKKTKDYEWVKWIPHVQNESLHVRNIICNEDSKNTIFEYLYVELSRRKQLKDCKEEQYIVIFVLNDWGIKNHPLSQYMFDSEKLNVTFVFCENYKGAVPQGCKELIYVEDETHGKLISCNDSTKEINFTYTTLSDAQISSATLKLAPIYCDEINLDNQLTKNITLYEMFNILSAEDLDLEKRWQKSQIHQSMAAPIGVKVKNEIVYLDLHEKYHGPHGLVAGTTGSGKSEILQTYILSMATLYHPYEVGFVIIDFKGGGMVNQFRDLPHLMGAITNIDGKEINRSLLSIKAELQKRQRLFAKENVNNINNYIKGYKNGSISEPLPHLIIIVDEFAELKAEQPEFMKELISTARIGRSLGVHLILATQKPSGQVNEQIWSNSKFKLCLKVQTQEDSNEVLKSPLAAEIKEPGRTYLQVGNNEIFELFQSAYSGAPAHIDDSKSVQEFAISELSFSGKRTEKFKQKRQKTSDSIDTQLDEIVDYISTYCKKQNIVSLPNICLPSLSDLIEYPENIDGTVISSLVLGVYDDPSNQYQGLAEIDVANENTIIIGSSQTGKTNLIQLMIRTLARVSSPKGINLYIIDFGSMTLKVLEKLHHVGGVVLAGEDEKIKNLFKLLLTEIQMRKEKLLNAGVSSYASYLEAGFDDLPRIVVFLDNFTVYKELYDDMYETDFIHICREGPALGITFVVTNATCNGLGYRYMSNFANRIALSCNDTNEYANLFERCRIEPKDTAGRILFKKDKEIYEAQTYLAFAGEKEIDRTKNIKAFVDDLNEQYPSEFAKQIPCIPNQLTYQYLTANYQLPKQKHLLPIGLDYSTVDLVNIDLAELNELCILGKNKAQKYQALETIFDAIHENIFSSPTKLYIIDNVERKLKSKAELGYIEKYTIDYSAVGEVIEDFMEELQERYEVMIDNGIEALNKYPLLLALVNSQSAIEYISENRDVMEAYNQMMKQFKSLKVMFIFSDIEDASVGYNAPALLKRLKDNKKALITNNLKEFKFCDVPSNIVRMIKPLTDGDAYYLNGENVQRLKLVKKEG